MNFLWLYQIPTLWLGVLVTGLFAGASVLGLRLTRPLARRLCHEQNDFANYFFATVAVFYAVLVGLIAVAVWGNYTGIEGIVSNEAVECRGRLSRHRKLSSRRAGRGARGSAGLRQLRDPARVAGPEPRSPAAAGGDLLLHQAARGLTTFEPATAGQQAVHAQTLHDLDDLFSNRRLRLEAVDSHLPGLMWLVVLAGAAVMMFMTFFFCTEKDALHRLLTIGLSLLIGLVIFLILALDRPLLGDVSVDASSFQDALATMGGAVP